MDEFLLGSSSFNVLKRFCTNVLCIQNWYVHINCWMHCHYDIYVYLLLKWNNIHLVLGAVAADVDANTVLFGSMFNIIAQFNSMPCVPHHTYKFQQENNSNTNKRNDRKWYMPSMRAAHSQYRECTETECVCSNGVVLLNVQRALMHMPFDYCKLMDWIRNMAWIIKGFANHTWDCGGIFALWIVNMAVAAGGRNESAKSGIFVHVCQCQWVCVRIYAAASLSLA